MKLPLPQTVTGILRCDGSPSTQAGRPGGAGWTLALAAPGGEEIPLASEGYQLGPVTNNQAEYAALNRGMMFALRLGIFSLRVRSDSQVLVKQMQGLYSIRNAELSVYREAAKARAFIFNHVEYAHIPREENEVADQLSRDISPYDGPDASEKSWWPTLVRSFPTSSYRHKLFWSKLLGVSLAWVSAVLEKEYMPESDWSSLRLHWEVG